MAGNGADSQVAGLEVTIVAHAVGGGGGMEEQLRRLAEGLLARGVGVTVVARQCELEGHASLRVVRVPGPRRPFSLAFPWFFGLGSLMVRRHRRGVVHTTGSIVSGRVDLSTVHFCHAAFHEQTGMRRSARATSAYRLNAWVAARIGRLAERRCYRSEVVRRLVAVSRGVAGELGEHFPAMAGRITVIPNGVDDEVFHPDAEAHGRRRADRGVGDEDLAALFVGGDWDRKGLEFAIRALAKAPGWRLVVAGRGDVKRYGRLAEAAGVGDRLTFAGEVAEPAPLYAAADAFLLPTAYETFSLATYEAAASGLPLLVSRVSGVEDILVEGRNGWFVERDAEAIAARLDALRAPELRSEMGHAALEASRPYGWESVIDAYLQLYRELAR